MALALALAFALALALALALDLALALALAFEGHNHPQALSTYLFFRFCTFVLKFVVVPVVEDNTSQVCRTSPRQTGFRFFCFLFFCKSKVSSQSNVLLSVRCCQNVNDLCIGHCHCLHCNYYIHPPTHPLAQLQC